MYKKGNKVKHSKMDWGFGIVLEDSDGTKVNVAFENAGKKLLSLKHVTLILLSSETVSDIDVKRIAEKNRVYIDEPFVDIFFDLKLKYPDHLIIIENGYYFEIFEQDAEFFSEKYGWKIYERQIGYSMAGFPEDAKKVWDDLRNNKQPFIVVSQLPNPLNDKIQRTVSEIFP